MLRKTSVPAHPFQGVNQPWSMLVQFAGMIVGQAAQELAALLSYAQDGTALVGGVDGALEEPFAFRSVHEFDCAIVF